MSLINQMLKDLEAREQDPRAMSALPPAVHSVDGAGIRFGPALVLAGCAVVSAAVGIAWVVLKHAPVPTSPAVGTVALAPPAMRPSASPATNSSPPEAPVQPAPVAAPAEVPVVAMPPPPPQDTTVAQPLATAPVVPARQGASTAGRGRSDAVSTRRPADRSGTSHLPAGVQPVAAESLYARGARAFAEGHLVQAREDFRRVLRLDPAHDPARLLLARCEAALGDEDAALDVLDQGTDLSGDAEAARLKAQLLLKLGRTAAAEQALASLGAAGDDAKTQGLLGATRQRQGRHPEAVLHYRRALQLQPGQSQWWLGLAISLEAGERYQEAVEAYAQAAALGGLSREAETYAAQRIGALRGQR